jgi:DNA-binding LytR/AlgR family response regulator
LIRCIIVEDEELAQDVIKSHLAGCPGLALAGVYRSAVEAGEALRASRIDHAGRIDLMFLDIRLPGMSGLNFLQSLPDPPLVVLTTAYAEYALESYELSVVDYLLKPISLERFTRAVDKVTARIAEDREIAEADHVFVKADGKFVKVNFADIVYVEGMKDYLKIHLLHQTLITLQTMSEWERSLPKGRFIRVHKSYIVAVAFIGAIFGNSVELRTQALGGQKIIPIGLNYREMVMNLIGRKAR